MAFSPDGTRLAAAAGNTVRIWDVRAGTQVAVLRADVRGVVITSFSPDGRFILTAGFLGTTTVWDAATGEALANFRGADGPATVWEVKAGYIFDARKADGLLTERGSPTTVSTLSLPPSAARSASTPASSASQTTGLVALARQRATRAAHSRGARDLPRGLGTVGSRNRAVRPATSSRRVMPPASVLDIRAHGLEVSLQVKKPTRRSSSSEGAAWAAWGSTPVAELEQAAKPAKISSKRFCSSPSK